MAQLLFSDDQGRLYAHPVLRAAVRSADEQAPARERPVRLPAHARLMGLPGRLPVGVDPATGGLVVLDAVRVGKKKLRPRAVAAVLPPGWTRTWLPASVAQPGAPVLPQWAYTAVGEGRDGYRVWALRTDRRSHWSPSAFGTAELRGRVLERLASDPQNQVLRQIAHCALEAGCFTAQNVFYGRDEGAIPASNACNARCVGCLSEQEPESGTPPSHFRILSGPSPEEMARVGAAHLERAAGRTMISFGQGCEGEPLTRVRAVEAAIRLMRARTRRGSIHLNTNGSRPEALARLLCAGLDSVRISLNSASDDLYQAYYRPVGYSLAQVRESVRASARMGAYVALNLLVFPGVSDREGEVEALCELVSLGVHQVQTRPLAIDPEQYLAVARGRGRGGRPLGVRGMIALLRKRFPSLAIGNFSRGLGERGKTWARPAPGRGGDTKQVHVPASLMQRRGHETSSCPRIIR